MICKRRYDGYRTDNDRADPYKTGPQDASRSALANACGTSARPTGRDIAVSMQVSKVGLPLDNKLLASLPRGDFARLLPHISTSALLQGDGRNVRKPTSEIASGKGRQKLIVQGETDF